MQTSLFDRPPPLPAIPGLARTEDFVGTAEAAALEPVLAALPFAPFQFHGWEGKRRTVSFGWAYDFGRARLQPAPPLPEILVPLRLRAEAFAALPEGALEQALVIEYAPGAGIGWHRDRPVFDTVVGISLRSACTLRLRRRVGPAARAFERVSLDLPPRSAYLLSGQARDHWEHSLAPLTRLRYSITFRSLRPRA